MTPAATPAPSPPDSFEAEQGTRLRGRIGVAIGVAALIHGLNLAFTDAHTVGLRAAVPLRAAALAACVLLGIALLRPSPRRTLERRTTPLWLVQLAALAALQYLSPRETVYPWSGALVFGSMVLTLGCGYGPVATAAILATGLGLPLFVMRARLGTVGDLPIHALVMSVIFGANRARFRLARAEHLARTELHALHASQLRAQREDFVSELHDGPAAGLARAVVLLERASQDERPTREALDALRSSMRDALREARLLMGDLDAPPARWHELVGDLRRDLFEACERAGIQASLTVEQDREDAPAPPLAHALRRALREAVTNALRHAQATRLWCALDRRGARVTLRVEDDGRGPGGATPGRGLAILRARAERLGGELSLTARLEGGSALCVSFAEAVSPDGSRSSDPAAAQGPRGPSL